MADPTNCFSQSGIQCGSEIGIQVHRISRDEFASGLPQYRVDNLAPCASSVARGNQEKWYDAQHRLFLKKPFEYQDHLWRDYICEQVAVKLGVQLGMPLANTFPCGIIDHGQLFLGSASQDFLQPEEHLISFYRVMGKTAMDFTPKQYRDMSTLERIAYVEQIYERFCGVDASQYLYEMICLDFLIGNEDRHLNNFGVIQTPTGFRLAPHFDNGLSLFEHDKQYAGISLQSSIRKMTGKPFNTDLKKAYHAAKAVFPSCQLSSNTINLDGIMFPSFKCISYVKYAADIMGLRVAGNGVIVND